MNILGIDISKAKFDVALLTSDGKIKNKTYPNNKKGFVALNSWLKNRNILELHACMEATGIYGEELATYLYETGYDVSVVNPYQISLFAKGNLTRNKTDKLDAKIIANYCKEKKPTLWQPIPESIKILQAMVKKLEALMDLRQQEKNRLNLEHSCVAGYTKKHLKHMDNQIAKLKKEIKQYIDNDLNLKSKQDLLMSIISIGEATIPKILTFLWDVKRFSDVKKVTAFVGVSPQNRESGASVHGKTKMCKIGNAFLRKALFMPAIVAKEHNPLVRDLCNRLEGKNKCKMVCIGAAMRKLLHIIYGVLKSGKPFDVNYRSSSQIFCG